MKYRDNEPKPSLDIAHDQDFTPLLTVEQAEAKERAVRMKTGIPFGFLLPDEWDMPLPSGLCSVEPGVVNTADVIQLDAHRKDPHIVLVGPGKAHVIPVSLIENVIEGKADAFLLDKDLVKDILRDWLTQVQADRDDGK